MRSWWPRGLALVVLVSSGAAAACSGNSKSQGQASGGAANDAGRGSGGTNGGASGGVGGSGGRATGGTAGSKGSQGGAAGSSAGSGTAATSGRAGGGGDTAGLGGSPSGGTAGTESGTGGEVADAGEGGAPMCRNLCTTAAPACCAPGLDCVERVKDCRIDVLTKSVGVTSDYATLQERIAANPQDVAVSITDEEIASAGADSPPATRFLFRLTDDASAAVGNALLSSENFPFRVSCGGEELFVGLVYMREGAAALRVPVLHIDTSEDPVVTLLLGAYQGAWYGFGSGNPDPVLTGRIDRPELRATFCERGVLEELGEVPP